MQNNFVILNTLTEIKSETLVDNSPGSLSLMADLRRPLQSSAEYGDITLSPGT